MSADAKVWFDHETMNGRWEGIHDGDCENPNSHWGTSFGLLEVLTGIEECMGGNPMRWELIAYANGHLGRRGFIC